MTQAPEDRCPECGAAFDRRALLNSPKLSCPRWAKGAQYPALVVAFLLVAYAGVNALAYTRPPSDLVNYAIVATIAVGAPFGIAFVLAIRGVRTGAWLVKVVSVILLLPQFVVVWIMLISGVIMLVRELL